MSVQWTVSFNKLELSDQSLELLSSDFEFVEFKEGDGNIRIDMEEGEFFSFEEENSNKGFKSLPTDGSNSWGKHI